MLLIDTHQLSPWFSNSATSPKVRLNNGEMTPSSPTAEKTRFVRHPVLDMSRRISSAILSPLSPLSPTSWDPPTPHPLKAFIILRLLGKGGSAMVYLVREKATGKLSALKAVSKLGITTSEVNGVLEEQNALQRLIGERGILPVAASFHDSNYFYILTPYYPGGDLAALIETRKRFSVRAVTVYAAELILAIEVLHSKGIMHRDIKPGNLLIDAEGHLVLADFGLARDFSSSSKTPKNATRGPHLIKSMTTCTCIGTPEYASPELLTWRPYSLEVDLWAYGVIIFELLTGRDAFSATVASTHPKWMEDLSLHIREAPLEFRPSDNIDPVTQDFLNGILQKERKERFTLQQMKIHPFFNFVDWDAISRRVRPGPWVPPKHVDAPTPASPLKTAFNHPFKRQALGINIYPGHAYKPRDDPHPSFAFSASPSFSFSEAVDTRPAPREDTPSLTMASTHSRTDTEAHSVVSEVPRTPPPYDDVQIRPALNPLGGGCEREQSFDRWVKAVAGKRRK